MPQWIASGQLHALSTRAHKMWITCCKIGQPKRRVARERTAVNSMVAARSKNGPSRLYSPRPISGALHTVPRR